MMTPPRNAYGASPPGWHRQRPGNAGSAAVAWLSLCLSTALSAVGTVEN